MRTILAVIVSALTTGAMAETPAGRVTERAVSCPDMADFQRYASLMMEDVSAAILFYHAHDCVALARGSLVRVDRGVLGNTSNVVCVRPVGAYACFWTFAGHVEPDSGATTTRP